MSVKNKTTQNAISTGCTACRERRERGQREKCEECRDQAAAKILEAWRTTSTALRTR